MAEKIADFIIDISIKIWQFFKKLPGKTWRFLKKSYLKETRKGPEKKGWRKFFYYFGKTVVFASELLIILIIVPIICAVAVFIIYAKDLPRPEKFTERPFVESTKIYDKTGKTVLYEMYGEEKRQYVALKDVSPFVKNAVVAAEDSKFYEHHGIDLRGILRSIELDLNIGKPTYGGSTISQQLIRASFLSNEKTVKRKIREIILTIELERRYSKDQILEWYLNQIPFGPNIYGVETASYSFFSKPSKDLNLNESAILASMVQLPSYYYLHPDRLRERRDYVLDRMAADGYITKDQAEMTKKEEVKFNELITSIKAPHFVFFVQNYLEEKYGREFIERGGFKIITSLDWDLQQQAEKIVKEGAKENYSRGGHNAALVAMDPETGGILAMVGSADWFSEPYPEGCMPGKNCLFDPKVNVATSATGRQPGSAFKPFAYVTAFSKGYTDKTIVVDELTDFGVYGGKHYIPHNYTGTFYGPVTLRTALSQSLNIPAVKVLAYLAGQKDTIATAQKLGITTLTQPASYYGLAIVLGGGEVRLLDMVASYGAFATGGIKVNPVSVLRIEDSKGNIIEKAEKTERRVLDEQAVKILNSILTDNDSRAPMFGVNNAMYFSNYQVAAKTGTTSDYKDGWIVGYTPTLVCGVWSGNSDNTPMKRDPGIAMSGPMWHEFMAYALPRFPKKYFEPLYTEPEPASETQNNSNPINQEEEPEKIIPVPVELEGD